VPGTCVGYTEYKLNEFVYPREGCGPLVIWENKDAALRYIMRERMEGVITFPCEYEQSNERTLWVADRKLQPPASGDFRDMDFAEKVKIVPAQSAPV